MENQNSLHMQNEKKSDFIDPSPVCGDELHLNEEYTQRVGLLNSSDEVIGWVCPHCKTEFDVDNVVNNFYGKGFIKGEA